jgi:hypothetical protein
MNELKRNSFSGQQKAKVALDAVRGLNELPSIFRLPTGGFYAACFS